MTPLAWRWSNSIMFARRNSLLGFCVSIVGQALRLPTLTRLIRRQGRRGDRLPYNGNADFAAAVCGGCERINATPTGSWLERVFTRLPPCVNLYGFDASF